MTHPGQFHIESLAALDHAIEAIDCEDLLRANPVTLSHMREVCVALLAAIETEQQHRVTSRPISIRSGPAWTTRQFRRRQICM